MVRKTCEEQYGGIGWASTEIMDKFKQTIRDKYDVEYITQNNDIRQKIIDTKIDKLKNKYDDILDIYFDQDANDYIYVCKRRTHSFAAGAAMLALEQYRSRLLEEEMLMKLRTKS